VEKVRERVRFAHGNLFAFTLAETYDVGFCRNLLIYFDAEMQAEAVRRLMSVLTPEGVFFVGHAEAAVVLRAGLAPLRDSRSFAFARKTAEAPVTAVAPVSAPVRRPVSAGTTPPVLAAARPFADVVRKPVAAAAKPVEAADALAEISALADQGRLAEAIRRIRAHLDANGPSARAYYLTAVAQDAAGDAQAAEAAYRKVLYLEPRHGEAITQLALLLDKRGSDEAARLWQRVRRAEARAGEGDA
jgi:chemotaxis protein methyltransferase WspC